MHLAAFTSCDDRMPVKLRLWACRSAEALLGPNCQDVLCYDVIAMAFRNSQAMHLWPTLGQMR